MRRAAALALLLAGCAYPPPPAPSPPASTDAMEPSPSAASPAAAPSGAELAWEVLPEAPFARLEMAVAEHDDRIWLVGGLSPFGEALTDVEIFDPSTGAWSEGPSLPTGIHHAALVSDGERLIVIGGYIGADFSRPTDIVLVLDSGGDEWTEGARLPDPRAAGAAAFDGSRVVYAGGFSPDDIESDVLVLEGEEWLSIGRLANSRDHLAATSDGEGTVWLLGGRIGGLNSNLGDVEVVTEAGISRLTELPTRRGGVAAFYTDAYGACLTGGEAPDQAYKVVECVDADGTVTTLPALNEPHHGHGAAVVDGVAYVLLGGPQPTLSADSTVEALRLEP